MMPLRSFTRLAAVAAVAIAPAACGDASSSPLAPAVPSTPSAVLSTVLSATESSELARVAREAVAQAPQYDSLQVVWTEFVSLGYKQNRSPYLMCDPLRYAATVKIVGPEGGEVDFGPHKLRIPRGALAEPTVITAEAPASTSVTAKFSPHGLQFAVQPTLTLSYRHCYRPHLAAYNTIYHDDAMNPLEYPTAVDRMTSGSVDARLEHFSGYSIGVGRSREY